MKMLYHASPSPCDRWRSFEIFLPLSYSVSHSDQEGTHSATVPSIYIKRRSLVRYIPHRHYELSVVLIGKLLSGGNWQDVVLTGRVSVVLIGGLLVVSIGVTLELTCFSGIHTIHGLVHAASSQASILAELGDQVSLSSSHK